MKKSQQIFFIALILTALSLSACWRRSSDQGVSSCSRFLNLRPGAITDPNSGAGAEQAKDMNALIFCFNRIENGLGSTPESSYKRFSEHLQRWGGFNCALPPPITSPLETNKGECLQALEKAPKKYYQDLMVQLQQKYIPAVDAMTKVMDEADNYFTQENYKDDQCAKGVVYMQKIEEVYQKYSAVKAEFEKPLRLAQREFTLAQLKQIEEEKGKNIQWQFTNIQIVAEDLIQQTHALNTTEGKAKYSEAFKNFENKYLVFKDYMDANTSKIQKVPIIYAAGNKVNNFYNNSKVLKRRLDENAALKDVYRELEDVIREYNGLVQDINIYSNMASYYDKMLE